MNDNEIMIIMKRTSHFHLNHIQQARLLGSKEQRDCMLSIYTIDSLKATAFTRHSKYFKDIRLIYLNRCVQLSAQKHELLFASLGRAVLTPESNCEGVALASVCWCCWIDRNHLRCDSTSYDIQYYLMCNILYMCYTHIWFHLICYLGHVHGCISVASNSVDCLVTPPPQSLQNFVCASPVTK